MTSGTTGELAWSGNWVSFLDTMLQMSILSKESRCLRVPTRIQSICIDPTVHSQQSYMVKEKEGKDLLMCLCFQP